MAAPKLHLDPETSHFLVEGYNRAAPFSSFLPGIAGKWGIPTWCFYVNRGQAVASFGVRDKDGQILEFQSFNQACMRIDREGFRTFFRIGDKKIIEPFSRTDDARVQQTMSIAPGELTLREQNPADRARRRGQLFRFAEPARCGAGARRPHQEHQTPSSEAGMDRRPSADPARSAWTARASKASRGT